MKGKYHKYTDEQIDFLREFAPQRTNKETTELFNKKFNLSKSVQNIRDIKLKHKIPSKYTSMQKRDDAGRFLKNGSSWNKGIKGSIKANSGSFKKGRTTCNCRPVGDERVTRDGYVEVKVKDPNTWQLKQRFIWEQAHGEIPKGHVLLFLDGDKTNFNLSNLQLVTRAQLARINQNRLISDKPELTKTGALIAGVLAEIGRRSKE